MWPRNVSISYILYYGEIYMLIFHVMYFLVRTVIHPLITRGVFNFYELFF